jgi:hypothetical protein
MAYVDGEVSVDERPQANPTGLDGARRAESHSSNPSLTPSPQIVLRQTEFGVFVCVVQA